MWNYKGIGYEKITNKSEITGFILSGIDLVPVDYPLANHQDVYNLIDYNLHYKEIDQLNQAHDAEIKRIFE